MKRKERNKTANTKQSITLKLDNFALIISPLSLDATILFLRALFCRLPSSSSFSVLFDTCFCFCVFNVLEWMVYHFTLCNFIPISLHPFRLWSLISFCGIFVRETVHVFEFFACFPNSFIMHRSRVDSF